MAKRQHDTEIWGQDWFAELDVEYRLLWLWILDKCDHAGVWKPNKKMFEMLMGLPIDLDKGLKLFNQQKNRILITNKDHWFLIDFFLFQYGNILNENNRVHESILNIYEFEGISKKMIRGLIEVKLKSSRPQFEDKDRVIDIDIDIDNKDRGAGERKDRPQKDPNLTSLEKLKSEMRKEAV